MNFQAPLLTTVNADRAILFAGTDWLYLSFYVSKGQNLLFSFVGGRATSHPFGFGESYFQACRHQLEVCCTAGNPQICRDLSVLDGIPCWAVDYMAELEKHASKLRPCLPWAW